MNIFHTFNIREIVKNSFRLRESLAEQEQAEKKLVEKQAQAKAVEAQPFQAAPRSQDKDVSTVTTYEGECVQLSFIGEENNCANQFVVYTDLKNPDCRAQCPDTIFKGFYQIKKRTITMTILGTKVSTNQNGGYDHLVDKIMLRRDKEDPEDVPATGKCNAIAIDDSFNLNCFIVVEFPAGAEELKWVMCGVSRHEVAAVPKCNESPIWKNFNPDSLCQ